MQINSSMEPELQMWGFNICKSSLRVNWDSQDKCGQWRWTGCACLSLNWTPNCGCGCNWAAPRPGCGLCLCNYSSKKTASWRVFLVDFTVQGSNQHFQKEKKKGAKRSLSSAYCLRYGCWMYGCLQWILSTPVDKWSNVDDVTSDTELQCSYSTNLSTIKHNAKPRGGFCHFLRKKRAMAYL